MLLFLYTLASLFLLFFFIRKQISVSVTKSFLIALFVRLFVLLLFINSKSDDLGTFLRDGRYLLYSDSRFEASYFPFVSYLGALALYLKPFIDPYLFLKLVFLLFDGAIVFPIHFLTKKDSGGTLLYAVNPITIIISVVHGQIDTLALFFFLIAIYLLKKKREFFSVFVLSLAVFIKTWPLLFALALFEKVKQKMFFILLPLVPLFFTLVYTIISPVSFVALILKIVNHRGIFGEWGYSKLIVFFLEHRSFPQLESILSYLFLLCFFIFSFTRKDRDIVKNIFISMLFFFVFTPTFGIQWFGWLVPFVFLRRPKLWNLFLLIASVYLTVGFVWDADPYFRSIVTLWNSVVTRVGLVAWLFMIVMFLSNLREDR